MKKEEKERLYEQTFPPYVPSKPFTVHFINFGTPDEELIYLNNIIKVESHFVFDTESDIHTYVPAIIQLLIMTKSSTSSIMLLIETCFLPDPSSSRFDMIKDLFHAVFRDGNYLYSWGALSTELQTFERYKLFSSSIPSHFIDVQALFTKWFNLFLMENMDMNESTNFAGDSLIIIAPKSTLDLFLSPSMINHIKTTSNQLWSLQDGIAYTLHKYLSKRDTCRSWAIGLDARLSSRNKNYSHNYRQRLITYASHDCLSLMELIWFIYKQYLNHCLYTEGYVQTLGEYFSFLKQKFTASISSSSVKKQPSLYDLVFSDTDDDSDDMLTVHELNEHQPSSLNRPLTQLVTTVDPVSIESTIATDLLSTQQSTTFDFSASIVVINQHLDTPNASTKVKRKPRRSIAAQKRRNQKASSRHRRNRYIYEIQRQINMDVTTIKNILDLYNIKYTNVNPVKNIIYIGVKSEQDQQHYEQLLPVDIFL